MNADAAAWMAGWVLVLTSVAGVVFVIWAYLQSVRVQEEHDQFMAQRRLEGRMQVPEIKLYSLAKS